MNGDCAGDGDELAFFVPLPPLGLQATANMAKMMIQLKFIVYLYGVVTSDDGVVSEFFCKTLANFIRQERLRESLGFLRFNCLMNWFCRASSHNSVTDVFEAICSESHDRWRGL